MKRTPQGAFVHPQALCESEQVGSNTRVWAFAHIMQGARVGEDCNICDHAFVETGASIGNRVTVKNNVLIWDKVIIEDDVFLGPGVVFTNDLNPRASFKKTPDRFLVTKVGHGATVGAGAVVICGNDVGPMAFIGAGAVVTADVLPHALVVGNPARRVAWVCECGEKLSEDLACSCGRQFRQNARGGLMQSTS